MKQKQNTKQAQSQNQQGIGDATAAIKSFIRMNFIFNNTPPLPAGREPFSDYWRRPGGGREGPPGRARSPGTMQTQFPDSPPVGVYTNEYQTINYKQKTIFFNNQFFNYLNYFIMKKQILILVFLVLAVFAGVNQSYGQVVYKDYVEGTVGTITPAALGCASSATIGHLHPTPTVTYKYEVAVDPATVDNVRWFVTDQATIIDGSGATPVLQALRDADGGGGSYINDAEDAAYNTGTNTQKSIDISWKNFDGTTNKVLLVAYVKGASGCTDNVQVWRIEPVFLFALDVMSMSDAGVLGTKIAPASECVSNVESATYDGTNLTMNYGDNYVFFSVNAENFVHSWQPAFAATASTGAIGTVLWAYPTEAIKTTGGTWNATTVPVLAQTSDPNKIVLLAGETIVIRVQIINGTVEAPIGTATNIVTLTIDGTMYDTKTATYINTSLQDLDEPVAAGSCVNNITDTADYIIKARPNITEVTPTKLIGPFEIKN